MEFIEQFRAVIVLSIFGTAAVIFVIWWIISSQREALFRQEISGTAARLNMQLSMDVELPDMNAFAKFYLFLGRWKYVTNTLMERSSHGVMIRFFDYCSDGVVAFHNPVFDLPKFDMYPETLLNKICDRMTPDPQDMFFEHPPQFNKMFIFETKEEPAVRKLFSDKALRMLEECKGMSISASGEWIIFYQKLKPRTAEQAERFITSCLNIYEAMLQIPGLRSSLP